VKPPIERRAVTETFVQSHGAAGRGIVAYVKMAAQVNPIVGARRINNDIADVDIAVESVNRNIAEALITRLATALLLTVELVMWTFVLVAGASGSPELTSS